jgi:hypothetical protein
VYQWCAFIFVRRFVINELPDYNCSLPSFHSTPLIWKVTILDLA